MTNFKKVGEFMKAFGQEVKSLPNLSSEKINDLRINLIEEELNELKEAIKNKNLIEVADALTDILYVTYGAGHASATSLKFFFLIASFNSFNSSSIRFILKLFIFSELKFGNDFTSCPKAFINSPTFLKFVIIAPI